MDRRYITGIFFLTIAVLIAVIFTDTKYREMISVTDTLQKKENEFKGQQILVREVETLNKEFAANIKDLKKVDKYLPPTKNIADLLVQMDYMASRNGLIIKDVKFLSENSQRMVGSGKYSVISVKLNLAGSYNSFLNFSEDIKNSMHLMDIISFSVKADKTDKSDVEEEEVSEKALKQEPVLYFDVDIDAYYQ